jgi:hypothetical protein
MTELENWLRQATRHLSVTSAARVRAEIRDHYESEKEVEVEKGVTVEEAERLAVLALGSPKAANCQYRRILLTSVEAQMLRQGNCEARAVCSRPWLKLLLLAMPGIALVAAATLLFAGFTDVARVLFALAMGMAILFVAPFLPIYTPARGLIFRSVKWAVFLGTFLLVAGPDTRNSFWLLLSCLWPVAWIEFTRASIRRKLAASDWPKHLYL